MHTEMQATVLPTVVIAKRHGFTLYRNGAWFYVANDARVVFATDSILAATQYLARYC